MSEFQIKTETIKDYLLGRISDEKLLEEMEDLLFSDDEFCDQVELIEDGLINDYSFGKLNAKDTADFENSLENNPERKSKIEFAGLLKEKAKSEIKEVAEKSSFIDSIKAFLAQPIYAGAFGLLLIAVFVSAFYFLLPNNSDELASLKDIYKTERPITSRVSVFEYAPYVAERSENSDDANKNKLRLIENKLIEAFENDPNAVTHHALGVFYLTQKKFDDAIKNLRKSVELDDKNPNYRNDLGTAYYEFAKNGEKETRLENLARANEEFTKTYQQNKDYLTALFNRSLTLQELNLQKQAEESWNNYLKKDSNSKWAEEARKNLEQLKKKENSFKTKEQVLDEFLAAYRKKDEKRLWQIHNETKGIFNGTALHQQLTRSYLNSRKRKDVKSANEYLQILKHIGVLEKEKHADFFFAELSSYYSNLSDSKIDDLLNAKKLLDDGIALVNRGKYSESIKEFEESKITFLKVDNNIESNIAELWVGEMLPDLGRIGESQNRLNTLISTLENKQYKVILPIAFYWMGVGKFRQKKFSDGMTDKKKAIKIAFETENLYEKKHSNESLAVTLNFLGEFDKSLNYLSEATFESDSFYSNKSQIWRNLYTTSHILEKLDWNLTATDFAQESVSFSREHLANTAAFNSSLRELIKNHNKTKRFDEALNFANEANKIALDKGDSLENIKVIADSFLERANVMSSMENCSKALEDFEQSLEFYKKIPEMTFNLYEVRKGRLLCFKKLNRQTDFQNELKMVLDLSEEYRQNIREDSGRQNFFESEQVVFDTAIEEALKNGKKQEAFDFLEASKARSLLDFIRSDKSIAEIENEFSEVAKSLTLTEIQTRMPKNAQIVQYSLIDNKLAIWVIGKDKFELVEKKANSNELQTKIGEYRQSILDKDNSNKLKITAQELFKLLIPNTLEKDKTICLILDKSLHQIPFASLISTNGKYLIEENAIVYSPSSSVFVIASENAIDREEQAIELLLGIGNPQFEREDYPNLADLPNAEIEAETIAKNYSDSRIFLKEYATKKHFLENLKNANVIHFAGHFIANGQSSSNSKLVFADDNLRSFELAQTKLNSSKLVVLSACETAFEKINNSEGAIGIGRTFLAMGTPIVVASNWKVDSGSTKDLMISFHNKRKNKSISTIESLRQAQIELLKNDKTKAPYYWSAFSAIGGFTKY